MEEKFYKIKLRKVVEESKEANIKSFYFDYDRNDFKFKAGQYVKLFADYENNPDLSRYMTIASSPDEDFLLFTMRIREESDFKRFMDVLELGEEIIVSEPKGEFILTDNFGGQIIMLAGGLGVTPFRSLVKHSLNEKPRKIILIYSAKNPEEIVYKNEFDELARQNQNFKIVYTITRSNDLKEKWKGETGRISGDLIKKIPDWQKSVFYVCGAPLMARDLAMLLKNLNIAAESVRIESFVA